MKLWGGRFEKATDGLVDDFHSSISFDQRLYEQDINGSIAHATMLGEQGIISREDAEKIVAGLQGILLYVGGNIVIGKHEFSEVEQRFKAMGFDRAFPPGTDPQTTIDCLKEDFHLN